ncbi:hypothetical protein GOA63_24325 [Sinorhizobium meliloti]|uniref:hypothetical protein n=1 Tax=Rhizobium meliloti TaxID=382 RepID=UPI001296EEBD|nr:hypothetical protein [Sinorhizobium meliloti]MDW9595316.1 hypothetical protein [Sinorhizobium meliloti]MDX0044656.1 hypothetical protein [Sinorhizobium meliloti]MQV30802.1 hypothetical protein [Sinorhizobium meliloti]MQX66630.1 hypothetical protein [Sinorhizobium meliloti]
MIDHDFDANKDGISPTLEIRLHAAKRDGRKQVDPKLIFAAAKVLNRVGGNLQRPHETLLFWDRMQLSELGDGLVVYAALTIATLPDRRFFQTGSLLEFGHDLAKEAKLDPWDVFVRENYPSLRGVVDLRVELSPLYPGSLIFFQRFVLVLSGVAAVSSFLSTADTAYEKIKDIYLPQAMLALDAGRDYAQRYAEGLQKLLVVDVEQQIPRMPDPDRLPQADRPPRLRGYDEE